jgi:chemotaxis protein MotA
VKAISAIGIGVAVGCVLMSAMMEGTQIPAFINIPAFMLVFGGTLGVTMAGTSMDQMKLVPKLYKLAFSPPEYRLRERVALLVKFAEMARREGLLALDDELQNVEDEFTRKGMQLVVDGTDPELVSTILEIELEAMAARHVKGVEPFEKAGGFGPTLGITGTVMGLIHVLENLSQPSTLGPAISGAFIATLYGVGSANIIFLPVANKLKFLSSLEMELGYLTIEGILAIQAGDNPRVVESKLLSYVAPEERAADGAEEGAQSAVAEPAAAAA